MHWTTVSTPIAAVSDPAGGCSSPASSTSSSSSISSTITAPAHCKRSEVIMETLSQPARVDASEIMNSSGGFVDVMEKKETGPEFESNKGEKPVQFSQQLIAFTLYGTQKELAGGSAEWPGSILLLSSRVMEVSKHFPDIPALFKFGLSSIQFGAVGVFCCHLLQKDTILGPFTGKKLTLEEAHKKYNGRTYWEIHRDGGVKYCLDGSDPTYRNWMYFIQYARSRSEQNLIAVQYNESLYFKAERDINAGEELLVWYDQVQYNLYMGIPQGFNNVNPKDKFETRHKEVGSVDGDGEHDDSLSDIESEDIEIEEDDDTCANMMTGSTTCSPLNSENEMSNDSSDCDRSITSNDDSSSDTCASSIHLHHQQILGNTLEGGNAGFTVYPLPTVQVPWVKHHPTQLLQTVHSPNIPTISWPIIRPAPPGPLPPTVMAAGSGHLHKPTTLEMFIRGADGNRWQCQICQKIFTSQGSLRAHARIHTGERPYQCRFCKRTFTQASTLRSHERLHTGERPYKCKHCGKAFTQSAGLRSHLKTHLAR